MRDLPGQIRIWSVPTGVELVKVPNVRGIRTAVFSPDGKTFLTGDFDGNITVRDAQEAAFSLADAQLVVARAGALTLAELAIMRRPAILIPLPTAADNHQAINAFAFQRAGAALVLPQPDASATRLGDLVDEILKDPTRHAAMAEAMGNLARPQATDDVVAELRAICRPREP